MTKQVVDEKTVQLLKQVVETYWKEDATVRERQMRTWKRLKLFWDGFSQVWYDEVAHDWRVWDETRADDSDQDYYDKPINIFRAYLESIIAALSVLVPPIKCYPDDADNAFDLLTAKAGDKIAQLIYRHNDVSMLWLHALYIYCTEGMIACYNYTKEDEKFGTYTENKYEVGEETKETSKCPECAAELEGNEPTDEIGMTTCPNCGMNMTPSVETISIPITQLVGTTTNPKSRQCLEVYGGLYIKIPNYAKKQSDCPYLFFSYEANYAMVRQQYPDSRDEINPGQGFSAEPYERQARLSTQYRSEEPLNTVTVRNVWLRPAAFQTLSKEDCDYLQKKYPSGIRTVLVNDCVVEYEEEALDDAWTLTQNPLSDYLYHDPLGMLLTSVQEITNDLVSLTLQTIEHGIPQTMADPNVLDFDAYRQMQAMPGQIIPAKPKSGASMNDAFYEVKTATLSPEILPFAQQIQSLGQVVTGALPSLFGGDIQGSKTASQYSMSRAQALQRLQNIWKMLTSWWKTIFGKAIIAYINEMKEDEKFVQKDTSGNFINMFIRKADLEGKLGQIELEANENLPATWSQQRDIIMQLLQASNPQLLELIASPENLPLVYEALGLTDLVVPGEDSRNKQYEEIKQLLDTEPIQVPPSEDEMIQAMVTGGPEPMPHEESSVEVGEFDNHKVELEICTNWLSNDAGRFMKVNNPAGYKNILLHAKAHKDAMMMLAMQQMAPSGPGAAPLEKPNQLDKEAPIMGEGDVQTA